MPEVLSSDDLLRNATTGQKILDALLQALGHNPGMTIDDLICSKPETLGPEHKKRPIYQHASPLSTPRPQSPEPDAWDERAWYRLARLIARHAEDYPRRWERIDLRAEENYVITTFKNNDAEASRECPKSLSAAYSTVHATILEHVNRVRAGELAEDQGLSVVLDSIDDGARKVLREHGYDEGGVKTLNPDDVAPRKNAFSTMNDILAANRKEPPGVMPTLEKGMEYIQALWLDIDRRHPGEFKHPLAPIVDVCYEIYNVREITREYERTHTVAVMKHPRGNIPHVSDLPPTNAMPQPQSMEQLVIDFLDPNPTFPPNLLSLIKVHDNGITRTKGGAVSHAFRLAIEGLMMLEPGMTERKYFMTLGEVIDNLQSRFYRGNEDEDTPPKRSDIFHRTNQMPYILDALNILDDHLTIPFRHIDGQIYDSWLPVKIRTRIEQDTSYNAPVFFEVSLPPDATQGYAIFKPYVRYLGFLSLPKLYAYSAYCSLMDKLGTRNGGMIRSTKPDGTICPKTGGIIDPRTNQLVRNENGKIVKNLYDSAAVKQLDRVPNPEAERCYSTIVLKHELIQECHLGEQNLPTWRKWQLAQKHWEWLKDEGYVDFEIHPTGYRFYPTDDLANQYHGVKIAAEAARKARKGKS